MKPAKSWICYFSPTGDFAPRGGGRRQGIELRADGRLRRDARCGLRCGGARGTRRSSPYRLRRACGSARLAAVGCRAGRRYAGRGGRALRQSRLRTCRVRAGRFRGGTGIRACGCGRFRRRALLPTARWPIAAGRPMGRLRRGRGLRARRGGETRCRRGAGDRCEEVADRAQRDALDVAVRAVRTRLPPQSEAASATGGGRDLGRQVHALRPLCETLPDGEPSSPATSFVLMRRSVSAAVLASRDVPSAHAATILPSHPCCRVISRNASATSRSCRACTTRSHETGTSGSGLFSCRFGVVELYSVPSGCSSRIMSRSRTPSSTIGWS